MAICGFLTVVKQFSSSCLKLDLPARYIDMSSNLRSLINVEKVVTFLYRNYGLMHLILTKNRPSWVTHQCPKLSCYIMIYFLWQIDKPKKINMLCLMRNFRRGAEVELTQTLETLQKHWGRTGLWNEFHFRTAASFENRRGFHCLPVEAVLSQNTPTKPITGCLQSDIHNTFSIWSFKWSFPLVTHATHFH